MRGQNAELLAVLGHRAPGDRETALLQRLRDFLVGLRLRRVLGGQEILDHLLDRDGRHISPSPDAIPLWKKNFSSNSPWGVSTYLFVVTRLIVDSCMPMSSPTSRSDSGRRCGNPRSRNARWNLTIDCVTLRSVRCRWSTLLISHSADRSFCSTYWRASLPEPRRSERESELTRSRGIPSSLRTMVYSSPSLYTKPSG